MSILPMSSIRNSHSAERNAAVLLALAAAVVLAALLSLRCGSQNYTVGEIISALAAGDKSSTVWRIMAYARLPRTLAALLAGAALALAGAITQSVLNNSMASPNVIGVNAGAGFFALLAAFVFPGISGISAFASFVGALATALFIYALAVRAGLSRSSLILAGLAVSSVLTAGTNTITLLSPETVIGVSGFLLGGFAGVTLASIKGAVWYVAAGAVIAALLAVDLNVLALGEESAAGLGLNVGRVRFIAIVAAALLAGGAVSFCGLLGFAGLLVPHMARRIMGTDNRWLFPATALLGSAFVLVCDVLARVLFVPFEIPVGIILSFLGGPFFLWLLLHGKRGRMYD